MDVSSSPIYAMVSTRVYYSVNKKAKVNTRATSCCQIWLKIADICCKITSSFSMMQYWLTQQHKMEN